MCEWVSLLAGGRDGIKLVRHATVRRVFQGSDADVASDDGTRSSLPELRQARSFSASQPLVIRYEEQTQKRILTTGCRILSCPWSRQLYHTVTQRPPGIKAFAFSSMK